MKALLKIISTYTLINIILSGISFVVMTLLTHYLIPSEFGLIQLSNGLIRFFTIFIGMGMTDIILTKMFKNTSNEEIKASVSSYFIYCHVVSISLSLLLLIVSIFYHNFFGIPLIYIVLFPLISLFIIITEFYSSYLILKEKILEFSFTTFLKFVTETIFIVLLIMVLNYSWISRIHALMIGLGIYFFFIFYRLNKLNLFARIVDFKLLKNDLKHGFPLVFYNISIFVFDVSDRFFLEKLTSLKETGIYSVSYTYSSLVLLVGSQIYNAIKAKIFNALSEGNFLFRKLMITYFIAVFLVCTIIVIFNETVFYYVFDEQYRNGKYYTFTLILGFFAWFCYHYFNSFLIFYNQTKTIALISIIGIFINIASCYFFIKAFGPLGAAIATLLSCIAMFVFSFYSYYFKIKRIHFLN